MGIKQILLMGCGAAAMLLLPAISGATAVHKCVIGKPTAASYTWNFPQEADRIVAGMRHDAVAARVHAEKLVSMVSVADMPGWPSDYNQLSALQTEVNDMSAKLCRLETIRRAVEPWQQKTIDRIARTVTLMADNTQDAIAYGSAHRQTLWEPAYQKYAGNLYQQARNLNRFVDNAAARAERETGHAARS